MKVFKNRLVILMAKKSYETGETISRRRIAEDTGISTTTVNRYARNEVQRYDTDVVETLLDYFGVTPNEFFEYVEVPEGNKGSPPLK